MKKKTRGYSHDQWSYTQLGCASLWVWDNAKCHNVLVIAWFSTNSTHALPINEEPIPLSVQTYFSFSWLLTDDGVEHRNVLKSIYQLLPPDFSLPTIKIVYYQHLLVSFEGLLSLRLSDHFALVVGCINNNWLLLVLSCSETVFPIYK